MLYDPINSPLLTGAAVRLNDDVTARDAYARVAEAVLGLSAPAFTDPATLQQAKDAVALQISHTIAAGVMVYIAKSESRGARSIAYRDDVTVNPLAQVLADAANAANGRVVGYDPSRWGTVISLRGYNGPEAWEPLLTDIVPRSAW